MRRAFLGIMLVLVGTLAASPALCAQKAALVIGNGAYRSVTPLINPPNDASDMAASLGHIGYAVMTLVKDERPAGDRMTGCGRFCAMPTTPTAWWCGVPIPGHGVQVKGHTSTSYPGLGQDRRRTRPRHSRRSRSTNCSTWSTARRRR